MPGFDRGAPTRPWKRGLLGALLLAGAPVGAAAAAGAAATTAAVPTVTALSPASGPMSGDTVVAVTGSGFFGGSGQAAVTSVAVGGTTLAPAAYAVVSDTELLLVTPPASTAGSQAVAVTTSAGTSGVVPGDQYDFTAGTPAACSVPTVSGAFCLSGTGGTLTVGTTTVGGLALRLTGRETSPGWGAVTGEQWSQPASTSTAGGVVTSVSLTQPGVVEGLAGDRAVYLEGTLDVGTATDGTHPCLVSVPFALSAQFPIPSGGTGAEQVTGTLNGSVYASGGIPPAPVGSCSGAPIPTVTLAVPVTEDFLPPSGPVAVTGVSPASGPATSPAFGGTIVTVTGSGFTGATTVDFGTTGATFTWVESDSELLVMAPDDPNPQAGDATVDVTVVGPGGTSPTVTADRYTYLTSPPARPTVQSVSPDQGPTTGGTTVTITGTGFAGAVAVVFGGVVGMTPAASFTVDSPTQITAVAPPAPVSEPVPVTVVVPGAGSSLGSAGSAFTYGTPIPVLEGSLQPPAGSCSGATVTIGGTALSATTPVTFDGQPATAVTVTSGGLAATMPAFPAGTTAVTVEVGTGPTTAANSATYYCATPPVVTAVSPAAGPLAGGTVIAVTGTGFSPSDPQAWNVPLGLTVDVGGVRAWDVYPISATELLVATPSSTSAGPVDVTVTTDLGTSPSTPADQFLYGPGTPPSCAGAVPAPGAACVEGSGGTLALTGTDGADQLALGVDLAGTLQGGTFDAPAAGLPFGQPSGTVQGNATDVTLSLAGPVTGTDTGGSLTLHVPLVLGLARTGPSILPLCQEQVAVTLQGAVTPGPGGTASGTLATAAPVPLPGSCGNELSPYAYSPAPTLSVSLPVTLTTAPSPPAVQRVFPASGPASAYTVVWVFGPGLGAATAVDLGSTRVLWRTFGPSLLALIAPPGPPGPVDVRVTTTGGTSAVTPADVYTRQPG